MDKIFFRDTESPLFSLSVIIFSNVLIPLKSLIYISPTRYYSILSLSWTIVTHSLQSVTCKGRAERMFRRLPPEKNRLAFKSVQRGAGLFDEISRFSAKIISRSQQNSVFAIFWRKFVISNTRSCLEVYQRLFNLWLVVMFIFCLILFSNSFFVFCTLIITCIDGVISTPNKFCTPAFMQSLATFDK